MAEERSDPEHISRILYGLKHEDTEKRHINEGEGERQTKRVDQQRFGVILWLDLNVNNGGSHEHNDIEVKERREGVVTVNR